MGQYEGYIGYYGKPGTGINKIVSWKYDKRSSTKVVFDFTDKDQATKEKIII